MKKTKIFKSRKKKDIWSIQDSNLETLIQLPITYTVPLGDWLEKKKATAIIIKHQFGFPIRSLVYD